MNATSRRDFLKRSIASGAAAAAALGGQAAVGAAKETLPALATKANEPTQRVSVLSYSFRGLLAEGKMDVFGYLETCKYRYELGAADIWSGFLTSTEEGYLKKVRDALDERGLVLADLAVDGAHVWEDNPDAREKNHQNALAYLRAAEILGARFMRLDAGGRGKAWTSEAFDHIVKRYREYAQWAADHGFKMGAENHWGPEGVWANMQKLYRAVNHPGFGVSCHLGGWQGTDEEKATADREAAPWVCHTHIAWNITEGPLVEKMQNLRAVGYQGYYSVEHHSAKNEYTEVAIQIAKVRRVLERWRIGQDG
jgi:sugar phosphate isomerase/epimerase